MLQIHFALQMLQQAYCSKPKYPVDHLPNDAYACKGLQACVETVAAT